MTRAVERGLRRRAHRAPDYVGTDEKAIARGQRYATIVCDLQNGHVLEVAPDRTKESLVRCLAAFSLDELSQLKAAAMDMWDPYIRVMTPILGGREDAIVFDRYHCVAHMNDAVDKVGRTENRALRADGDDRLVGSKHMWLYGIENLPQHYQEPFGELRAANLKTARAWAMKETLRSLWDQPTPEAGLAWYKRWHFWATHARLNPVKRVAKMLRRHLHGVLAYFTHRITNSASEALNSTIQMIKKRAFGFRSFANFRTAILFRSAGSTSTRYSRPTRIPEESEKEAEEENTVAALTPGTLAHAPSDPSPYVRTGTAPRAACHTALTFTRSASTE
jgi:transposase